MPPVTPDALRGLAAALLRAAGAEPAEAGEVARVLVEADLRDHPSHGVRRVPGYCAKLRSGEIVPRAQPVVERDDGSTLRIDGRRAFGQLAAGFALATAVERAGRHGVAAVGLRRAGHVGRLADIAERGAARGFVTLLWANDSGREHTVRPPGGVDGRLSTNPIAAGIPRPRPPHLVLDMATTVKSHGTVLLQEAVGQPMPADWSHEGWLLPLAGPKGFGLALVAEVLAGVLAGAGHVAEPDEHDFQGLFVVAIDPARFLAPDALPGIVDRIADHLKAGGGTVLLPGEAGEAAARRQREQVDLADVTWRALTELARELDVAPP